MSFSGKLHDVGLQDLLLMIASRRRSGRLTLRREGAEAVLLFRGGKILAAVSSADPQTLGSLLLTEGHITEQDLYRALELQRQAPGGERLTGVLERTGAVSKHVLEEVVQRKVASVIEDLLSWTGGYFHFVPAHVAGHGEVEVDAGQFVGRPGLGRFGDHLLTSEVPDEAPGEPAPVTENPPGVVGDAAASIATLAPLPAVTGEVTLRILEAAKSHLGHGVLFVVSHDAFRAVSRFGVRSGAEAPDPDAPGSRDLRIPLEEPSILRDAVERGEPVRGAPEDTEWNRLLFDRLGGVRPAEVLAIPVTARERTLLVLYGDRLADDRPIGEIHRLERVAFEVGVEIERGLAERRRRRLEELPALESMESPAGGIDGESLSELSRKLDHLARQNETIIHEFRAREQSLWHLAHHDPLTGLPNRFLFWELLRKELAHARQEKSLVAVALFDIDHFKDFNDRFGEEFGDELLSEVSRKVSAIVRDEDTLARLGGDRWALVIPKGRRADNVMLVVRRVFEEFGEPLPVEQDRIRLSLSMGISIFPEDGSAPGELVRNAEVALKRAKQAGRNNFQVFMPAMNEWAQVRMELAQDLRRAVARSEDLFVLFQPIVSVESGALVGGEALLRWKPPERSPIEAQTLVELAEDTGLMPALGSWVLREACLWNARWQEATPGVPVSVNVSIRQFQAGDLVESVVRALDQTSLAPELLRLEITESIAAQNEPEVRDCLDRLHKLGVEVVLDDFGAGYSSLSYLMRYSATGLKIDRSFVRGVPHTAQGCAVVEATIGLGRQLGLDVVAEGVERDEQLEFLRVRGCPFAQGTLLSEPVLPEVFQSLLRKGRLAGGPPTAGGMPSSPTTPPTPSTP
ncbi:MAG: EAL domain-containing protein [Acidobacteriota bacterium]|jgi:diguanylate cyclase (GGDEF)-like protein